MYSQLIYCHCDDGGVLSVSTVFVDYTYGLLCGCVALALSITAVQCASKSGVHQGSVSSKSGSVWCGGVAADCMGAAFAFALQVTCVVGW